MVVRADLVAKLRTAAQIVRYVSARCCAAARQWLLLHLVLLRARCLASLAPGETDVARIAIADVLGLPGPCTSA